MRTPLDRMSPLSWRLLPLLTPLLLALGYTLRQRPQVLTAIAVLGVAAAGAMGWRARLPYRRIDRLFWVVTLRPLASLPEAERRRRLGELASVTLHHPVLGRQRFPVHLLERRLAQAGSATLDRLLGGNLASYRELLDLHRRR